MIISSKELYLTNVSRPLTQTNSVAVAMFVTGPKPNLFNTTNTARTTTTALKNLVSEDNFFGALQLPRTSTSTIDTRFTASMSQSDNLITAQKDEVPTYCLLLLSAFGSAPPLPAISTYADLISRPFFNSNENWLSNTEIYLFTCGTKDSDAEVILLADSVTKGNTYRMSDIIIDYSRDLGEIL